MVTAAQDALESVAQAALSLVLRLQIDDIGGVVFRAEDLLALTAALGELEATKAPKAGELIPRFLAAVESGMDCAELFELRNEIKRHLATEHQELLNQTLRQIGCRGAQSHRPGAG